MSYTAKLAEFTATLTFERIPDDVVAKTKWCVLDCLGNILAGSTTRLARDVLEVMQHIGGPQAATVLGTLIRLSAPAAALVNGTMAEMFELQDGWRFGNVHPSVVIPAGLAVAQWHGLSGRALLVSIVAGYEVTDRLAWAVHPHHLARGYLPTGTAGTCGSAATVSCLLGCDAATTANALGIAGFLLPVSTAENLWAGYAAKPLHSGYAAKTGIEATLLATRGIDACGVEGTPQRGRGFLEITTGEAKFERLLDGLGTHFTVRDVYFKNFPVCRHAHGAAQAAVTIGQTQDYRLEEIERIEVSTYELAASLLNRYPDEQSSVIACQFSVPFVVAAGLVHRRLGIAQLAERAIHDPQVLALARKIHVAADADLTARYPHVTPARVEVVLHDGRILRHEVEMPKGDPRAPLSERELMDKFRELAGLVLAPATIDRVADAVLRLEQMERVGELVELMESG